LFEFLGLDVLASLSQVVLINLVLASDNVIVIGLAAAGQPHAQRRRVGYTNPADRRHTARGRDPAVVGVLEDLARVTRLLGSANRSD